MELRTARGHLSTDAMIHDILTVADEVCSLKNRVDGWDHDKKNFLQYPQSITPGVGCKFAYDKNGFILRPMKLLASDIPDIQISQIRGLQNRLDDMLDVSSLNEAINNIKKDIIKRSNKVVGSGTKVNYDENGLIVSTGELLADDIPILPISKIDGLSDIMNIITSISNNQTTSHYSETRNVIRAGTFTKVSVDSNGYVTSGESLTMNDLPVNLITKLNDIEKMLPTFASQKTMDTIMSTMSKKINVSKCDITPGEYTKVIIDNQGIVTKGSKLTIDDLPEITIDMITDLRSKLNSFASHSDVINLNQTVSTLMSSMSSIGDINHIKHGLEHKADADEFKRLKNEFIEVRNTVGELQGSIGSYKMIEDELRKINDRLSTLEGRIVSIESKILYKDSI